MQREGGDVASDLAWLTEQIWGRPGGGRVHVATDGVVPAGYRPVERFAVVPSLPKARFLIPLSSRRVASASLRAYSRLRPLRTRGVRVALGVGMQVGLAQRLLHDHLTVSVAEDVAVRDLPSILLTEHLRRLLGGQELAPAIGIGRPGPNRKPTLQLFALDGRPLGFAKVGWNEVTRRLVANEARALAACGDRSFRLVAVPRLLFSGGWNGLQLSVVAPLPAEVRRHRRRAAMPPLAATQEIADVSGRRWTTLGSSRYWRRLSGRLEDARAHDLAPLLERCRLALELQAGTVLPFGGWHGDWVPWNLAWRGRRLHVWDWEHSAEEAPVGFDVLHYHFHVPFTAERRGLAEALERCQRRGMPLLATLGLRPGTERLVLSLYLVEMLLRYHDGMRFGTGWNPRFYPEILRVLDDRLDAGLA
jgi:hypothetical protein